MKIKHLMFFILMPIISLGLLTFMIIFLTSDNSDNGKYGFEYEYAGISTEVLYYKDLVEKYAGIYGISEYTDILLAIIQVENEGLLPDVMQSSESKGLEPNTIDDEEESINQGCKYFSYLVKKAGQKQVDEDTIIQSYNYGEEFIDYVAKRGKKYNFDLAENFSRIKAKGVKVKYSENLAKQRNGGYRYKYGNMFYVPLIRQLVPKTKTKFDSDFANTVINEALKYKGYKYVFGGSSPATSFDCSGLTQWCYKKAGINLPRTAQAQYNYMEHIPLSQAEAGDLIFFHSTYNTSSYITHVGIYVGNMQMYHAGSPLGYADLRSSFWQNHLVGAGRIKK